MDRRARLRFFRGGARSRDPWTVPEPYRRARPKEPVPTGIPGLLKVYGTRIYRNKPVNRERVFRVWRGFHPLWRQARFSGLKFTRKTIPENQTTSDRLKIWNISIWYLHGCCARIPEIGRPLCQYPESRPDLGIRSASIAYLNTRLLTTAIPAQHSCRYPMIIFQISRRSEVI